MKVFVENFGTFEFTKANDGWYECKRDTGIGFAINPNMTVCKTDPWYASYVADAPKHEFKIVDGK